MSGVATAIGGSAVLGAGVSLYEGSQVGNGPDIKDQYTQGPNFQANQDIVGQWKNWLTGANADNNYGAISPDWNDIWQQTQQQVKNYYEGSATTPGVNDAIKGSFAQRGMGGQAGETFALAGSGANEAQTLGGLSAQQNIAKQNFANQGKNDWLSSMGNFVQGTNNGAGNWSGGIPYSTSGQVTAQGVGAAVTGAGNAGVNYLQQQQTQNWMQSMSNSNNGSSSIYSDSWLS